MVLKKSLILSLMIIIMTSLVSAGTWNPIISDEGNILLIDKEFPESTTGTLKNYTSLSAANTTITSTTTTTTEGVIGGGGGGISPSSRTPVNQEINTTEELSAAISLCYQEEGEPVNIKGGLYCKKGEVYTPLADLLTKKTLNLNIGGMIIPDNPIMGWAVIILLGLIIFYYFRDEREIRIERKVNNISKEEKKKQETNDSQNDRRKRRSDGGYY